MKKSYLKYLPVTAIIALMNFEIWQKEQILASDEILYLKIVPQDPRSLMQGDYMRLHYEINNAQRDQYNYMIVKGNEQRVAQFVRFDDGSALQSGEKRLKTRFYNYKSTKIKPDKFFFQEGHGAYYAQARYGIFTFASNGAYLLTGLADDNFQRLDAPHDYNK